MPFTDQKDKQPLTINQSSHTACYKNNNKNNNKQTNKQTLIRLVKVKVKSAILQLERRRVLIFLSKAVSP